MCVLLLAQKTAFDILNMLTNAKSMHHLIFGLVCREGMSPNVTLHWFAHPQWFDELGEFQKEENIPLFVNWAETAFKLFGMPKSIVHAGIALCCVTKPDRF